MATYFILAFDEKARHFIHNFRQVDAVEAAKAGKLNEIVKKEFKK